MLMEGKLEVQVLFLCAGYGTRIKREMESDKDYQHLSNTAKALLPINNKPLISYWFPLVEHLKLNLITNNLYHLQFKRFDFPVFNNNSNSNSDRNGSVKDIHNAVQIIKPNCLLVIAGDTFINLDFSRLHLNSITHSIVTYYKVSDQDTYNYGILQLDFNDSLDGSFRVTGLLEKPGPITDSRFACPCFYLFNSTALKLLDEYVNTFTELKDLDASGKFISWLVKRDAVYAIEINGRIDIGNLKSYKEANDLLKTD